MSRPSRTIFSTVIATTVLVAAVHASERVWHKDHRVIGETDGTIHAEFTYIRSDPEIPFYTRWLYKGGNGDLLVLRQEMTTEEGSSVMTIEHLGIGEVLTIDRDFEVSITLSYGTEQVFIPYSEFAPYFAQHGDYMPSTKAEAAALFANMSPQFRNSLHLLAGVGSYHSYLFSGLTAILNVFLDDLDFDVPVRDVTGDATDDIQAFDPNLHPPGAFELQFGDAYYECCPGP